MEVTKITAQVRYSRYIGGSWKSVELGSEATVDARENWQSAQAYLYHELGKQLKSLWANGNGSSAEVNGSDGYEDHGVAPSGAEPDQRLREGLDWCEEHQVAY